MSKQCGNKIALIDASFIIEITILIDIIFDKDRWFAKFSAYGAEIMWRFHLSPFTSLWRLRTNDCCLLRRDVNAIISWINVASSNKGIQEMSTAVDTLPHYVYFLDIHAALYYVR